ncbi:hypothetical protein BJY22_001667 [Kribbella shirazensis]|uniref:Uncharacterized protein n=1 Tax=Kribbella shirazensis TaxID=1105143 RepID=A0A7X5V7A5_9ACTN|nr:hypothetical protein [Kribbella shirazensis]
MGYVPVTACPAPAGTTYVVPLPGGPGAPTCGPVHA